MERVEVGEKYLFVENGEIHATIDLRDRTDNRRFEFGNYFLTEEKARIYAEKEQELFKDRLESEGYD